MAGCALLVGWVLPAHGAVQVEATFSLAPGQIELRPSFEACSYYFRPKTTTGDGLVVEFRAQGEETWQQGFEPVSDLSPRIWKGSLFNLREDCAWELRVRTVEGKVVFAPVAFRTWSSHPPIAKTVDLSRLPIGPAGLVLSEKGSPEGWIKYTVPPGWKFTGLVEGQQRGEAAITFLQAQYVILEGVTIEGGRRYGVLVDRSRAVRILNCDISGWGRVGRQRFDNTGKRGMYVDEHGETINLDGGIKILRSAETVVERCYVHDPRGRANSWMFAHPAGPSALHVEEAAGGTVVRWNDFVGSDEHRWNDVIESSRNGDAAGGFHRDADISGNFLVLGNDDGIELEGGGMNVRFYRNKIEGTTCGISTGACRLGPQFVFENIVANPGDESGLALMFFKNSHGVEQSGKRHFINNTLYGPNCSAYGAYGKPIGTERIGFMRNNVFVSNAARAPGAWARRDDFDGDIFWVGGNAETSRAFVRTWQQVGQEAHGAAAQPQFVAAAEGDFHLAGGSAGSGQAVAVTNVTVAGANCGALANDTEVPFRPLAFTATPRQLNFMEHNQAEGLVVKLQLPATAAEPARFEIRKNRVFTWFDVQPAAGVIPPGGSLTLTVRVKADALLGRPIFRGAFLVRTPEGLSRPVSIYARGNFREELRPTAAPDAVYLEAADLVKSTARVKTTLAPTVRSGRFVTLSGGTGEANIATVFRAARAGHYSLLARASVDGDVLGSRAYALTIDGTSIRERAAVAVDYQWNTGAKNFRVIYLNALGELAAGEHRLSFELLRGELNVNELIVTDNPAAFFIDHWQREKD